MFPNEIIRDANVWRPVSHSTDLVVSGFAARAGVITARPPRLRATSAPIILDTFGKGKFCPLVKRHETVHGQPLWKDPWGLNTSASWGSRRNPGGKGKGKGKGGGKGKGKCGWC
jgi:hypothetical protein